MRFRQMSPLIVLLHAWPLQGVDQIGNDEELPDVERDLERNDAVVALQELKLDVALKCLPLNRDTIAEALMTARVILIGTHGSRSGGLVFEKGIGEAELVTKDELKETLKHIEKVETRMVFVSACHSEEFGQFFVELGVDYSIAIVGEERVSNLASRAFFQEFLKQALVDKTIKDAVEDGIRFVETHPKLPPERQVNQRKKFAHFQRNDGNVYLFDPKESPNMGVARDLTESSDYFGFKRRDLPNPIIGRHSTVRSLAKLLKENRRVTLVQSEPGLGSSIVAHFLCRYMGDRNCFSAIIMRETFVEARFFFGSEEDLPENLLVIDTAWGANDDEDETWFYNNASKFKAHLFVIDKRNQLRFGPIPAVPLDALESTHAERLRAMLLGMQSLPNELMLPPSGNPRKIIEWVKSVARRQPVHLERLRNAKNELDSWESCLDSIIRDCVIGPDVWSKKERRFLEFHEVTWIKRLAGKDKLYPTLDQFWMQWLRPTLETLSALEPYWTSRSLLGFVSEEETNKIILRDKDPGTFLLRCSETRPGALALSYVGENGAIQKTQLQVKPDGSIIMQAKAEKVQCSTLGEAVMMLRFLKKVVVSVRDGAELVNKNVAFSELFM